MACTRCQSELVPGANFCHVCGQVLDAFCRRCNLDLPSNSNYCFRCGDFLNLEQGVSQPHTNLITRTQVAPKIKKQESEPEGERKLVSIVFADLSGFTKMSESMDPEAVTDIMNSCFQRLGKCVYDCEGYIDKFMGDCIMALFGAPIAHENDPELAIKCSLAMLKELEAFNHETGLNLAMSIGINSGIVVAGGVGSDEKFDYTVMGDAVNLAQRLQSAAQKQQILISKNIYNAVADHFECEELEPIQVKGKAEKVEVFAVTQRRKEGTKSSTKSLFPNEIVGRDREIGVSQRLLEAISQEKGQCLLVSGEPGVGKSRFKREVKINANQKHIQWFEGKCELLNREVPYFSIIRLIQNILSIDPEEELSCQKASFKKFNNYGLDDTSVLVLLELVGLPSEDTSIAQLDAGQKKRAIFLAVKKLLLSVGRKQPSVFYLEDLHWMDSLSRELFQHLLDSIIQAPILLYGSFRRDFQHQWHDRSHLTQLNLQSLNAEQSVQVVQSLLSLEEVPQPLSDLIVQKSDGNPLYIEEILKSLIDSKMIHQNDGTWIVSNQIQEAEIPTTLQGLIAARIDRLDENTKQVLQYASVIGREFSDLLLSKAASYSEKPEEAFSKLKSKELIFELSSELEEVIYIFKHALTQEVAYESILMKKRRELHQSVAATIEALYSKSDNQKLEESYEALAHHYSQAENADKAIFYLLKSAKNLSEKYSNEAAIDHYDKALKIIEKDTDQEISTTIDALYEQAQVFNLTGDFDSAENNFRRIAKIAEDLNDHILLAKAFRSLGEICKHRGHIDTALEHLHRAQGCSEKAQDFEGKIRTYKVFGSVLQIANRTDEALKYYSEAMAGAKQLNDQKLLAQSLNDTAIVYININSLDKAESHLEESIEISNHHLTLRPLQISSTLNLGVIQYYRKDYSGALVKFKESALLAEQIGDLKNVLISKHNIGEVLREFNNDKEALKAFEECHELAIEMGNEVEALNNFVLIGYLYTKVGEEEKGEAILHEAITRTMSKKLWSHHSDALFYLGKYYTQKKEIQLAKEAFRSAEARATEFKIEQVRVKAAEELNKLEQISNNVVSIEKKKET